jgi:hypothetical protein
MRRGDFRPDKRTNALAVPVVNVATVALGAQVVEGVSRRRNALIRGDELNVYNMETGYTCHQIGNGGLIVQLPQPYLLDSMRCARPLSLSRQALSMW